MENWEAAKWAEPRASCCMAGFQGGSHMHPPPDPGRRTPCSQIVKWGGTTCLITRPSYQDHAQTCTGSKSGCVEAVSAEQTSLGVWLQQYGSMRTSSAQKEHESLRSWFDKGPSQACSSIQLHAGNSVSTSIGGVAIPIALRSVPYCRTADELPTKHVGEAALLQVVRVPRHSRVLRHGLFTVTTEDAKLKRPSSNFQLQLARGTWRGVPHYRVHYAALRIQ